MERTCLEQCPEIRKIQLRGLGAIASKGWDNGAHVDVFAAADDMVALAEACPGVCAETRVIGARIPRPHGLLAFPEPVFDTVILCQSPNIDR